jgi:hypothetical protein
MSSLRLLTLLALAAPLYATKVDVAVETESIAQQDLAALDAQSRPAARDFWVTNPDPAVSLDVSPYHKNGFPRHVGFSCQFDTEKCNREQANERSVETQTYIAHNPRYRAPPKLPKEVAIQTEESLEQTEEDVYLDSVTCTEPDCPNSITKTAPVQSEPEVELEEELEFYDAIEDSNIAPAQDHPFAGNQGNNAQAQVDNVIPSGLVQDRLNFFRNLNKNAGSTSKNSIDTDKIPAGIAQEQIQKLKGAQAPPSPPRNFYAKPKVADPSSIPIVSSPKQELPEPSVKKVEQPQTFPANIVKNKVAQWKGAAPHVSTPPQDLNTIPSGRVKNQAEQLKGAAPQLPRYNFWNKIHDQTPPKEAQTEQVSRWATARRSVFPWLSLFHAKTR